MIYFSSIKYNNGFRTGQDLSFLISCLGETVTAKFSIYYENIVYATIDNKIEIKPDVSEINLADNTGIITVEDGGSFSKFFVGDTIGLYDNNGNFFYYTVTEKFDDGMIRTSGSFSNGILDVGKYIFNATPFTGLRFNFNLIDTGNTFYSLVDGEYQEAGTDVLDCTNTTPVTMSFAGAKSYQTGSVTVVGDGAVGGGATLGTSVQQKFTITHTFIVTPLFLYDQYSDILLGKAPTYFNQNKTLNYIGKIGLGRSLNNPNGLQEIEIPNSKSSVGWFNENFNAGPTNYSVSAVTITDVAAAATLNQLQFGKEIRIDILIDNATTTPFSSGNTKYVFGFNYLPEDEAYYQKNGYNFTRNFVLDKKQNTLGSGSVNGDNYGTDMQVLKTLTSTYISSSQMKVTAVIEVGDDAYDILTQGNYYRYAFWVITENHSLSANKSDKVNLLVSVNEFDLQLTTSDLIEVDGDKATFIAHPYDDKSYALNGYDLVLFPVDDLAANLDFHIDFTTHPASEGIKINKIQSRLILKHSTEADIVLEDFSFSTSAYPIIGGKAQNIDFSQDRIFKIDSGIRKTITCERDYVSDVADDLFYNYSYPFMIRWEYWKSLGLQTSPSDLFDPAEPNNGLSHFWQRFADVSGWHLYYDVDFTIEQNGVAFSQNFSTLIEDASDYDTNTDWDNNTIKSYDLITSNEIVSGVVKYVYDDASTKIVASFEKIAGPLPSVNNIGIVIWAEIIEGEGIGNINRISSFRNVDSNSWFKSIGVTNKVVLANTGSVYTGTAILDYSKIPKGTNFTLYARIYEFYNNKAKQFMSGEDFEFMDGTLYEFQ